MAPTSRLDSPPIHLPAADISLEPTGTWTSPDTQGVYPMGWNLLVDSLDMGLILTPAIEEAEFAISTFIPVIYWEGAVAATGSKGGIDVSGRGFVEMVGYVPISSNRAANSTGPTLTVASSTAPANLMTRTG